MTQASPPVERSLEMLLHEIVQRLAVAERLLAFAALAESEPVEAVCIADPLAMFDGLRGLVGACVSDIEAILDSPSDLLNATIGMGALQSPDC